MEAIRLFKLLNHDQRHTFVACFLGWALGGFLMQFMVQGAWGVVPVHLNEVSPADFRGTFPGLAYQLGNFTAAYAAQQQAWLAEKFRTAEGTPNYALTMALVECVVFIAIIVLAAIGREERGKEF